MLNLGARNKAAFISQIFTGRRLSAKLTEGLLLQISSCNLHLQSSHHLQWSPLLYTRRAFAQMQDSAKSTLVILSEGRSPKSKDLVPQVHLLSKFYFIKWASPKILRLHYVSLRMT